MISTRPTSTRAFILLLCGLATTQNSFAMDLISPESAGHINKPEKLDPKLLAHGRFGRAIPVELPTQAEREVVLTTQIQTLFFNPQYNYAPWVREARAVLSPRMIAFIAHSTNDYSLNSLLELVDNMRATARQNNYFDSKLVENAIGEMDEKARAGVYEAAKAAKAADLAAQAGN
jgi:SpoVK/Ycf46/Vps4 family AAA+-type ATPase